MKRKDEKFALNVAKLAAEQSSAERLKVGAVITDTDGNIIAYGYNGSVRGGDNILEDIYFQHNDVQEGNILDDSVYDHENKYGRYRLVTKPGIIHAEENVLMHAARRGISVKNGVMFQTHSPCEHCTALMIQAGIKKVVFLEKFRTYSDVMKKYSSYIEMEQHS